MSQEKTDKQYQKPVQQVNCKVISKQTTRFFNNKQA